VELKPTAGSPKPQDGDVVLRLVMAAVVTNGTTPNYDDPTIDYKAISQYDAAVIHDLGGGEVGRLRWSRGHRSME
jgi:hypothetical protein